MTQITVETEQCAMISIDITEMRQHEVALMNKELKRVKAKYSDEDILCEYEIKREEGTKKLEMNLAMIRAYFIEQNI
jgi:hypothetical protein